MLKNFIIIKLSRLNSSKTNVYEMWELYCASLTSLQDFNYNAVLNSKNQTPFYIVCLKKIEKPDPETHNDASTQELINLSQFK